MPRLTPLAGFFYISKTNIHIRKLNLITFIKIIIFVLSKHKRRKWQSLRSIGDTIRRTDGVTT